MASKTRDSFLDLERHRRLLEENIKKLRDSLRHWQTWEAEYEGLKEEILAVDPVSSHAQLLELGREYEGELVNQKEVEGILGTTSPRTAAQAVNLLDRRLDYVERNARTIQTQLEAAENKLAAATVISTPDARNEEGLPLADIVEELDEDGNIISSHISTPGSAEPQLLEALQKSGIKDIVETDHSTESVIGSISHKETEKNHGNVTASATKTVQFAPDTKPGPGLSQSQTAKRVEEIVKMSKRQSLGASEPAIIPTNESPEDAALRQEMLQYGLSEVGSVVAELDLEEGSDWSDDDPDEDEASSMDDEDEYGRSTSQVVSDELRREMKELEKRLDASVLGNIGSETSDDQTTRIGIGSTTTNGPNEGSILRMPVSEHPATNSTDKSTVNEAVKKTVRFSENLDIAPESKAAPTTRPMKTTPVGDVVERTGKSVTPPTSQRKPSRFKAARSSTSTDELHSVPIPSNTTPEAPTLANGQAARSGQPTSPIQYWPIEEQPRTVPAGPEGIPLAPNVVERDVPLNTSAAEPNEFDPHLLHQEVATEYHRARNRMIQRQGGFMAEDESVIVPLTEEEGGPKKMSRFKAARLARQ